MQTFITSNTRHYLDPKSLPTQDFFRWWLSSNTRNLQETRARNTQETRAAQVELGKSQVICLKAKSTKNKIANGIWLKMILNQIMLLEQQRQPCAMPQPQAIMKGKKTGMKTQYKKNKIKWATETTWKRWWPIVFAFYLVPQLIFLLAFYHVHIQMAHETKQTRSKIHWSNMFIRHRCQANMS